MCWFYRLKIGLVLISQALMDHKTCAIYIAEGPSSLFQPACLSVHLFAHPLNLGFPSFTQLPITKFQIKKDAAYVSNDRTMMPLVRTGSMDSVNLSNQRLFDLELRDFVIYSIRFNGYKIVWFGLLYLFEPFLQISYLGAFTTLQIFWLQNLQLLVV